MAETLLALLLVNSSAKGPNVIFRWPPQPEMATRLARPFPCLDGLQLDNPWRAANHNDLVPSAKEDAPVKCNLTLTHPSSTGQYEWKSPSVIRDRSRSFSRSVSLPVSGCNTPSKDHLFGDNELEKDSIDDDYHRILDYSTQFLAGMLCPKHTLCHQKFDLVVDDLAFIGHPVCSEDDGHWRFKSEKSTSGSRGRGSTSCEVADDVKSEASANELSRPTSQSRSSWLHMFHFVLMLDMPDPPSSASGNISKYFDTVYEQIVFTITAVLFQEQVLSNFVEVECDSIGSLEAEYVAKGGVGPLTTSGES